MEKQLKFYQTLPAVALVTGLILLVPLVAMQFTSEVDWGLGDFIVMGILLFSAGAAYVLLTRYVSMMAHRIAIASAIGSTLLLIWVNLAVGLIGSGGHAGNFLYAGIVAIAIISTILSRFKPKGMQYAMFAVVGALALLTAIAFMANMHHYPGSSSAEILGVNAFFATLFAISGLLFRYVALEQASEKTAG